jgi:hypothetical protein
MSKLFPRVLFSIIVASIMTGCSSDKSDIENVIKQQLKDPESAMFRDMAMNQSKNRACIVWNAKNSLGGYGDLSSSYLRKAEGNWKLDDIDTKEKYCSQVYFDAIDEFHHLLDLMNNSPKYELDPKNESSPELKVQVKILKVQADELKLAANKWEENIDKIDTEFILSMNKGLEAYMSLVTTLKQR